MPNYNYLKEDYLDAAKASMEKGNENTVYTFEMVSILAKMAKHDVYPDGRFADADCNIWSMFRS